VTKAGCAEIGGYLNMTFSQTVRHTIAVAGFIVTSLVGVHAQQCPVAPANLKPLTNDLTRGQLLQEHTRQTIAASAQAKGMSPESVQQLASQQPSFQFPHDALYNQNNVPRQNSIFGIDISHHQGNNFPFSGLAQQSVSYVYVKATQGTDFKDPIFPANWTAASGLPSGQKISLGAFHFLSSDASMSGTAQADCFVDYVNANGGFQAGGLPPAVDLEWDYAENCGNNCVDRWTNRTTAEIVATVQDFFKEVKSRAQRTPMVYTNVSFLNDNKISSQAQINQVISGYKVWIFDPSVIDFNNGAPNPANNLPQLLWQFTSIATLTSPSPSGIDADLFLGTPGDFQAKLTSPN
jgi:lysozyme